MLRRMVQSVGMMAGMLAGFVFGEPPADQKQSTGPNWLPNGAVSWLGDRQLRHGDVVRCLAFSPDGKTVATGTADRDGTIRLWDVATGRELWRTPSLQGAVSAIAFSPDGKTIWSGGSLDPTLRQWQAETGGTARGISLNPAYAKVYDIVLSRDGRLMATGNTNATISLWNTDTAEESASLQAAGDAATLLSLSSTGKLMVSWGTLSHAVRMWDVAARKQVGQIDVKDISARAVFAPDGASFATGSREGAIRIWSASDGAETARFKAHEGLTRSLAYAPDGKSIITSGDIGSIRISTIPDGAEIRRIDGFKRAPFITLSPDGKVIAARFAESSVIRLINPATGETIIGGDESVSPWTCVAGSRDDRLWASAENGAVRLWDVPSGKSVRTFTVDKGPQEITFSPDGKQLLARFQRGLTPRDFETTLLAWDTQTGAESKLYRGTERGGRLSDDGRTLAVWDHDKPLRLRRIADESETIVIPSTAAWNIATAFSADGEWFAAAAGGGDVQVRPAASENPPSVIDTRLKRVTRLALSHDGRHMVCAAPREGEGAPPLELFDVREKKSLRTLAGHKGELKTIAFSPNAKFLAAAGDEKVIFVWNLATGDIAARFTEPGSTPFALAFSTDGATLLSAASGGYAILWRMPKPEPRS